MVLSLILFLIIITLSVSYLNKFKRKTLGFLLVFILITIPTTIIYLSKGNLETFFFEEKINKIVQEGINDPQNFKNISPQVLIIFLEKKLCTFIFFCSIERKSKGISPNFLPVISLKYFCFFGANCSIKI